MGFPVQGPSQDPLVGFVAALGPPPRRRVQPRPVFLVYFGAFHTADTDDALVVPAGDIPAVTTPVSSAVVRAFLDRSTSLMRAAVGRIAAVLASIEVSCDAIQAAARVRDDDKLAPFPAEQRRALLALEAACRRHFPRAADVEAGARPWLRCVCLGDGKDVLMRYDSSRIHAAVNAA
jgi:hypothetical protein